MANINSKAEARKRVREAQVKANAARAERERCNEDDATSFLVELGRMTAVDDWEQDRLVEIRAEGERRRYSHRQLAAAAVGRMQDRGESLAAIAELTGVEVRDVRAVLKSSTAQHVASPDAVGAPNGVAGRGDSAATGGAGGVDEASRALGVGERA